MKRLKNGMKLVRILALLTQLGFSVAFPLAGSVLAAVWLRSRFDLGAWVLVVGIVLGFAGAVDGFVTTLKAVDVLFKKDDDETKGDSNGISHIHHS